MKKKEFRVLIQNYNLSTGKFEVENNSILNYNLEQIISLLKEMPVQEENEFFKIRIITDEIIIQKDDNVYCTYSYNNKNSYAIYNVEIENINKAFENWEKEKENIKKNVKKEVFLLLILGICPCINLIIISEIFLKAINEIFLFSILIWLFSLTIISLFYSIGSLLRDILKSKQEIPIKYSIPFISTIRTFDASNLIIIASQMLYLYIFVIIHNIGLVKISFISYFTINIVPFSLLLLSYFLLFIAFISVILSNSYELKKVKNLILQVVNERIHNEKEWNAKLYYFNIASNLEKRHVIVAGFIPKLSTSLTLLFTLLSSLAQFF